MEQPRKSYSTGITLSPAFRQTGLLVITSMLLASCARYYYAPNSNHIPLLREREARINIQYTLGDVSKGMELQSAFAISSHFGTMINTMIGSNLNDDTDPDAGITKTTFIEVAPGYFTNLGASPFIFETYGGIGTGGVRNQYSGHGNSKVKNTRYFIQPIIGLKVKRFECGFSSRWSFLNQQVVSNTLSTTSSEYSTLEDFKSSPHSVLWEPGVVMRFGGEKLLVQLQFTLSENLTHPDRQFLQESVFFSAGLSFPIRYKSSNTYKSAENQP